jgi:flagellar protein FlbT
MQAREATTPIRQVYFAVQIMLMDPGSAASAIGLARNMIVAAIGVYRTPEIVEGLRAILVLVESGRYFEALKLIRSLYPAERQEMHPGAVECEQAA